MNTFLKKLKSIYAEYKCFDETKIPLCAAENYVAPYVKAALTSRYEGKYISGYLGRNKNNDFIGSDYLEKLLVLSNEIGEELFGAKYCDFRCLTGMNTVALMLMIMVDKDKKILITDPLSGGHGSLPKLCDNFGVKYESIPYNASKMQIDYVELNKKLQEDNQISFLFFCQSDLIQPPNLSQINLPDNVGIIYDATQTLGLIAGKTLENPLNFSNNVIMIGGTHKTFPGVTCGFVGTNNQHYIERLDTNISPNYLRNIQSNNILSVCLSMIELQEIGQAYAKNIIKTANDLGKKLEERGVNIKKIDSNTYTYTHQIYIQIDPENIEKSYQNFKKYGVTLNKRITPYVTGFRLGVQEIARYKMCNYLDDLASLIALVLNSPTNEKEIFLLRAKLSNLKEDIYYLDKMFMEWE